MKGNTAANIICDHLHYNRSGNSEVNFKSDSSFKRFIQNRIHVTLEKEVQECFIEAKGTINSATIVFLPVLPGC